MKKGRIRKEGKGIWNSTLKLKLPLHCFYHFTNNSQTNFSNPYFKDNSIFTMPQSFSGSKSRSVHHGNLNSKKGHINKPAARFLDRFFNCGHSSGFEQTKRSQKHKKPTKTDVVAMDDKPPMFLVCFVVRISMSECNAATLIYVLCSRIERFAESTT